MRHRLTASVRAGEWWDFKLVPMLSVFYATALTLGVSVGSIGTSAVALLLSISAGAACVSVINDVFDQVDDAAAGKTNRIAGRPRRIVVILLAVPIVAGFAFVWLWRDDVTLLALYLGSWLAFTLYSVPPFRFKRRGLFGVIADASGAHLFPTLLAVILACRGAERDISASWILSAGLWAVACGVRGILWHQLSDVESDRIAGVGTFAQSHSPRTLTALAAVLFPLELAALASMLMRLPSRIPATLLVVYAIFAVSRKIMTGTRIVMVAALPNSRIVLNEYYECLLPMAVLVASAFRFPVDWWVLAVHLVLFPNRPRQILGDGWQMARAAQRRFR